MREFLELCGFETGDIEKELPRIEKAFDRLGITHSDIERGKQRLTKYYDMELQGVRKAIGFSIREVVDTVLAREDGKKKIIYGYMCPGFEVIGYTVASKSEEIQVSMIPGILQFVLGCIFDKMVPILEAAEQKWLKAGKMTHCGNGKTLVGLLTTDLIPKPDLLVTSGQLCDTAPKTFDLLHELYDIPVEYYDTCHDRELKEYPSAERVINLLAKSTKQLVQRIEEIVGFKITDAMILDSINARSDLGQAVLKIRNLMENSDPLPISPTHENVLYCLNNFPRNADKSAEIANTIYEEVLQNRVNKGKGVTEKGAPRVLTIFPQNSTDPRQEHLLCELGIASVSSETGFCPLHGNRSPDFDQEKPKDPYEMIGQVLHRSIIQYLDARTDILIETCKRLHVDGALMRYHIGCRRLAGDAIITKDEITKQLGIPCLLLEWENFDPRIYNEEQLKKRLELFKDIMANKK